MEKLNDNSVPIRYVTFKKLMIEDERFVSQKNMFTKEEGTGSDSSLNYQIRKVKKKQVISFL